MGISFYLVIGLIWSAVYDALLREDGEESLTVFQGLITIALACSIVFLHPFVFVYFF